MGHFKLLKRAVKKTISIIMMLMLAFSNLLFSLEYYDIALADDEEGDCIRLIVTGDDSVFEDEEELIGSYQDVHILQYSDEKEANEAYERLSEIADSIEEDVLFSVATNTNTEEISYMTEEDNPLAELEKAIMTSDGKDYDVAVIDTGSNITDSVSMVGDDGLDRHGHGDNIVKTILDIAPSSKILSIKAIGDNGTGDTSAVYAAIKYAISQNVKIINLSISAANNDNSSIIEEVICEAIEKGIIVVGAAGNNGGNAMNYIPGKIKDAVIVGASDLDGRAIKISNKGETVDFLIPAEATSLAAAKVTGYFTSKGTLDGVFDYFYGDNKSNEQSKDEQDNNDTGSKTISFDIVENFTVLRIRYGEGEEIFFRGLEGDYASIKEKRIQPLEPVSGHVMVLDNPGNVSVKAFDSFGYDVSIRAFSNDGKEVQIGKEGDYYIIPTDGSVVSVVAGRIENNFRVAEANKYKNDGMTPATNIVLRFAKAIGFDVDRYLASNNAWKSTVDFDAFWNTSEGQAIMSGGPEYHATLVSALFGKYGGETMSATGKTLWQSVTQGMSNGTNSTWSQIKSYVNGGNGVQCAGLVSYFFTYIYKNLYDDDDLKLYYDAWDYGLTNSLYKPNTLESKNIDNVASSVAGTKGLEAYKDSGRLPSDAEFYAVTTATNGTGAWTREQFISMLDEFEPGAIIIFGNESTMGSVDYQGGMALGWQDHVGIYVGEANGLHWMFHTNVDGMKPRLVALEYYSATFMTNSQDEHKGKVYITRAGGTIKDKEGFFRIKKNLIVPNETENEDENIRTKVAGNYRFKIYTESGEEIDKTITISIPEGSTRESSEVISLPPGRYYLMEYAAPNIIMLDKGAKHYFTITGEETEDNPLEISLDNTVERSVKIKKTSTINSLITDNKNYSMKGIKYNIYSRLAGGTLSNPVFDENDYVSFIKLAFYDQSTNIGSSGIRYLPVGDYYIQEDESSVEGTGFIWDKKATRIRIRENSPPVQEIELSNEPTYGVFDLTIKKLSTTDGSIISDPNNEAIFKVEYFVSYNWSGSPVRSWHYRTQNGLIKLNDESYLSSKYENSELYKVNGKIVLPLGIFRITEVKAPRGYLNEERIIEGKVTGDLCSWTTKAVNNKIGFENDKTALVYNTQIFSGVSFSKMDVELGERLSQENATLKGAEITIYNNSGKEIILKNKTKVQNGKPAAIIKTDENGLAQTTNTALPVGKYYAKETAASEGYVLNNNWRVDFEIVDNNPGDKKILDLTSENNSLPEQIIRGDLEFMKVDIDGSKMSKVPFLISRLNDSGDVIESHVIVTDENGIVNTAARSKTLLNTMDDFVEGLVFTDPSKLDENANIWFGADNESSKISGLGSLAYGRYIIQELSCEGINHGQTLIRAELFDNDKNLKEEFTHGKVFKLDNVFVNLNVILESDIIDNASNSKTVSLTETTEVTDEIRYIHLKAGDTYKLKTKIIYEDKEGSKRELGGNEKTFRVNKYDRSDVSYGKESITVTIDSTGLNGGKVHAVDELYALIDGEEVFIGTHNKDMTVESQVLEVPYMGTVAGDGYTGDHQGSAIDDGIIIDTINYEGFPENRTFIVEGTLRYADTGEAVIGVDGEPCIVNRTITISDKEEAVVEKRNGTFAGPRSGSLEMPEFRFNAKEINNRKLVVTEVAYDYITDEPFLEHNDLNDENQTVYIPAINTEAKDPKTDERIGCPQEETVILDDVLLSNLIVGQEYTVRGILYDKETGEKYMDSDGKIVEGIPITFIAKEKDETKTMEFRFNGNNLKGKNLVVFEDLYYKDVIIASHSDINSDKQSIYYPDGRTEAKDAKTKTHKLLPEKEATVIDTFYFENLRPGLNYLIKADLVNKETGEIIAMNTLSFCPESKDGSLEIEFNFNAKLLEGATLVAFETVEYNGVEIILHKDINDEAQTIIIEKLKIPEPETPEPETPEPEVPKPVVPETGDESRGGEMLFLMVFVAIITIKIVHKNPCN